MARNRPSFADRLRQAEEEEGLDQAQRPAEEDRPGARRGRYYQRTMRLPAEYVDGIDAIAEAEHMSKADTERWLVGVGLQAYAEGRRPGGQTRLVREVDLPEVDQLPGPGGDP